MDKLLEKLSNMSAVSGNESEIFDFILNEAKKYSDDIKTDSMNNLYVFKKGLGENKKQIMLCAHMDEVGFIISSITEDGCLLFRPVGGIDESVICGKTVEIGKNKVKGITGIKAIHLTKTEERNKKVSFEKMYIDIGADSKEEAESLVEKGDYVNFVTQSEDFGNLIKGKSFDDRLGCYILLKLMEKEYYDDLVYVFTVQEETGLRGAKVASYNINPDFCYVLESTTCLDFPTVPLNKKVTKVGSGPALTIADRTTYANKQLNEKFAENAEKYQYKLSPMGGNDAGAIHLNGIKTSSVSIPARYIHSPVSVVSFEDVKTVVETFERMLVKGVDNID